MRIKRNEPFRYSFGIPVKGEFYLVKEERRTPSGPMEIFNISPSGMAIATSLKLPIDPSTLIVVEFSLMNGIDPLSLSGQILHEKWINAQRLYGLQLNTTKEDQQRIISAIKQIVKETH